MVKYCRLNLDWVALPGQGLQFSPKLEFCMFPECPNEFLSSSLVTCEHVLMEPCNRFEFYIGEFLLNAQSS